MSMFYQILFVCLLLYLIQVPLSTMKINLLTGTVMSEQIQHLFPHTACMKDFFNVQAKPKKNM